MFADGAAPTQWDFGRYSSRVLRDQLLRHDRRRASRGRPRPLATSPHGLYVTDSAAAASAMSTGIKVENGAISVAPDGRATAHGHAGAPGRRASGSAWSPPPPCTTRRRPRSPSTRNRGAIRRIWSISSGRWSPTCSWAAAPITSRPRASRRQAQGRPRRRRRVPRQGLPGGAQHGRAQRRRRREAARVVRGRRHGFRGRPRSGSRSRRPRRWPRPH